MIKTIIEVSLNTLTHQRVRRVQFRQESGSRFDCWPLAHHDIIVAITGVVVVVAVFLFVASTLSYL